tara:strand:- start:7190 stop:8230 length:1041 start_codon:yes stop_codon:yes gene_type:complete
MSVEIEIVKQEILESIDQLIRELQAEQEAYFEVPMQFSIDSLHTGLEVGALSKLDLRGFQVKHGIKVGTNVLSWSKEYKKEVVSNYMVTILANVMDTLEILRVKSLQQFDFNSPKKLKQFFIQQLKYYHKLSTGHEGLLYIDPDYRSRTNNLLKSRFDAIWFINEQYTVFPLEHKPDSYKKSKDADYPFIDFNVCQWIDFETSYNIIPLLKKCLSKNLEPIIAEGETARDVINDRPLNEYRSKIFKSAEAEDLFRMVLSEFDGLNEEGIANSHGFQVLCEAFYSLYKDDNSIFKHKVSMVKFIFYLKEEYQAKIKSKTKLSDGTAHRNDIRQLLSDNLEYQRLKIK